LNRQRSIAAEENGKDVALPERVWRDLPDIEVSLTADVRPRSFVEPSPDYRAIILNELKQEVGRSSFGINPLGDALYLDSIEVHAQHQKHGYASAFLCWLYKEYRLPITPVHIIGSAIGFWAHVRKFPSRLLEVKKEDLRVSEMDAEKARWAHLIPEPEHIRLQRICKASPEWQHRE